MNPIFVKRKEVERMVALSYFTIYHLEKAGKFPNRKQLTEGRVGWLYSEVVEWAWPGFGTANQGWPQLPQDKGVENSTLPSMQENRALPAPFLNQKLNSLFPVNC